MICWAEMLPPLRAEARALILTLFDIKASDRTNLLASIARPEGCSMDRSERRVGSGNFSLLLKSFRRWPSVRWLRFVPWIESHPDLCFTGNEHYRRFAAMGIGEYCHAFRVRSRIIRRLLRRSRRRARHDRHGTTEEGGRRSTSSRCRRCWISYLQVS